MNQQTERAIFRLQSINLERKTYGDHEGKVVGKIRFHDGYDNEIALHLTEQNCQLIMKILADQLVEQTQRISGDMTARIINQVAGPALESPKS